MEIFLVNDNSQMIHLSKMHMKNSATALGNDLSPL
jgi:hypothetical protein